LRPNRICSAPDILGAKGDRFPFNPDAINPTIHLFRVDRPHKAEDADELLQIREEDMNANETCAWLLKLKSSETAVRAYSRSVVDDDLANIV